MDEYWVPRNEILIGDMNYQDIEIFIITRVQDLEALWPDSGGYQAWYAPRGCWPGG